MYKMSPPVLFVGAWTMLYHAVSCYIVLYQWYINIISMLNNVLSCYINVILYIYIYQCYNIYIYIYMLYQCYINVISPCVETASPAAPLISPWTWSRPLPSGSIWIEIYPPTCKAAATRSSPLMLATVGTEQFVNQWMISDHIISNNQQ